MIEHGAKDDIEISSEYEEAGKIFFKSALWDLGIFSQENIKAGDWEYYLTYSKGIKVLLENGKSFFIDLPLPIERCIREAADALICNRRPFLMHKVSDEELFKSCMDAQPGHKIDNVLIVDYSDHIIVDLNNVVERKREYNVSEMIFVESLERNFLERARKVFFTQNIDNNSFVNNILNLKGFDTTSSSEIIVTLLTPTNYDNKTILEQAAERLNGMHLRDEEDRLVKVKIQ